jgi:hypothetical protein
MLPENWKIRAAAALVATLLLSWSDDSSGAVVGGYAVSTDSRIAFVEGDGQTTFPIVIDSIQNITGLTNGNIVGRVGADQWRIYTAQGAVVATRQLDNLGTYNDVVAAGNGGYVALTDANVIFVGADGDTVYHIYDDPLQFGTTLTNGKIVALKGADLWRLYDANGDNIVTRALDNSGTFTGAAALGGGGYVAVSDSRLLFMAADGTTVNNVILDVVQSMTTLSSGNVVGRVGTDVWTIYNPLGSVVGTRALDGLGTFAGAAPLGNGGYVAYTDTNAIFMAADGNTVNKVVTTALDFVTPLNNGNVLGHAVSSDLWHLFDPLGNILATRVLDNLGTFTGAAPTGSAFAAIAGDFDVSGDVDALDLAIWKANFGLATNATVGQGDADGDQDVDGNDFLIWQRNLAPASQVAAATSIPEPSAIVMAAVLCGHCAVRRKRHFAAV